MKYRSYERRLSALTRRRANVEFYNDLLNKPFGEIVDTLEKEENQSPQQAYKAWRKVVEGKLKLAEKEVKTLEERTSVVKQVL